MSLVEQLMKREKLILAQELARQVKSNADLMNQVLRKEIEVFWLRADVDIELPPLPDPLEIGWPSYNGNAIGCGVEDRNIRDRYQAALYGWEQGVDQALSRVPEEIYSAEQMQAYALEAVRLSRGRSVP